MENPHQSPAPAGYIREYEQMAFGMFVHFGLYSQLNSGEWTYHIHNWNEAKYRCLKDTFRCGDLRGIIRLAKAAGCRYVTLTTRHHDGFSLYDTQGLGSWDVMHSSVGRDLVREFVDTCREENMVPFFYHTTLDWLHPDFNSDFGKYLDDLFSSIQLLCTNYGKIGGFWFDGNWSKTDADWHEDRLYSMIHRLQPEAMIINNTGLDARGEIGCEEIDAVTFERGMPRPLDLRGRRKYVAGEMCETLCDHWGKADDINFKSVKQLIQELCECRKVGANFLLNVGPSGDGTVEKMQEAILECIGRWMAVYGRAIYNGRPFRYYQDKREFILRDVRDENTAYLFWMDPHPGSGDSHVTLGAGEQDTFMFEDVSGPVESVSWMDNREALLFRQDGDCLTVHFTGFPYGQSHCVRVAEMKFKEKEMRIEDGNSI